MLKHKVSAEKERRVAALPFLCVCVGIACQQDHLVGGHRPEIELDHGCGPFALIETPCSFLEVPGVVCPGWLLYEMEPDHRVRLCCVDAQALLEVLGGIAEVRQVESRMGPIIEGVGIVRVEANGLIVVFNGAVVLTLSAVRIPAVAEGDCQICCRLSALLDDRGTQISNATDAFLQEIGVELVARKALEAVFIDGRIKKLLAL